MPDERTVTDAGRPPDPTRGKAPKLWGRQTLISGVIALVVLVVIAFRIDWAAVWEHLRTCDKGLVLLAGLSHYATYSVRGARWRRTLRHLHGRVGYTKFGLLVFFYNFVDNLVPAKLGDLYAAHLARINLGIRRSAALGSIVFLRMIDAWIVVVLAALGSWLVFSRQLPDTVMWVLIFGGAIAVVATLLLLTFAVLRKHAPARLPEGFRVRIEAFQAGMWPRNRELATIAVMTFVIWALEATWILLLVRAFGLELGFAELLVVTMIPLLASGFPLTPSGAGVVELSLYGCLRAVGAAHDLATAITVLNRLIDYWLHIALGIVTWALRERLGLRTWKDVPLDEGPPGTVYDTTAEES